jgi:predicted PurR-regulated permease PerM
MGAVTDQQAKIAIGALALLAAIVSVAALKYAQSLAAPIALALVVGVVLAPMVRKLSHFGIPRAASASFTLITTGMALILLLSAIGPVATGLMEQMPKIEREIRIWLDEITRLVRGVDNLGRGIEQTISDGGEEAMKAAMPGLIDALWMAPNFAAQTMIFAGTLFFFLLTRDDIYSRLPNQLSRLRSADRAVSHYFVTVTLINAGLGTAVFGVMTLIGLPQAMLWGAAAFLLNFILYLGPIMLIIALTVAGLSQFNGAMILVPALSYFALNLTEAQFVTPTLVGQRLSINPLGVFVAILFGLWLWGPIGGIVALPVVVWFGAYLAPQSILPAQEIAADVAPVS